MLAPTEPAHLAVRHEDNERFKIAKGTNELREDGIRLDPATPSTEWW
jgi:hypothetical protein